MKRLQKYIWGILPIAILAFVLWRQVPVWYRNWQWQGAPAPQAPLRDLTGRVAPFPPVYGKWIVVFWATWCGPCKVELARLSSAVNEGSLDGSRILAVSIGEKINDVIATQNERLYPFTVLVDEDAQLARKFGVSVTPTVVFLNPDNRVAWASSGISPSLIYRARAHLQ